MAIAPTRIAAFEFLIQFRSLGRGQIRSAARQLGSLTRASAQNQRIVKNSAVATAAYASALRETGLSARQAIVRENRLAFAISRTNAAIRGRARQNFQRNIARAASSRSGQAFTSVFGANAGGNLALFRARTRAAGFSVLKFAKAFSPLAIALKGITGLVQGVIGAYATLLKVTGVALGVFGLLTVGIARLADSWTVLINRIRVASDGTQTIAETSNNLLSIALNSRAPLKNVAELYGRLSINAKQFNVSQADVLKVVDITSKAIKIAGSTSREAEQATLQFAQALGSNRLSGDELRSVREQAPELAQTIARGLKIGVGDLKRYGEQGLLTTKTVVDAIISQQREVNIRFGRIEATFSDGVQSIGSSFRFFTSSIITSLKLGPKFFSFSDKLSRSFQEIAKDSGFIALAARALPQLFRDLGFESLEKLSNIVSGISNFFEQLPSKIKRVASEINNYSALRQAGFSAEDAINASFSLGKDGLTKKFSGLDGAFKLLIGASEFSIKSIPELTKAVVRIADLLESSIFFGSSERKESKLLNFQSGFDPYASSYQTRPSVKGLP